MFLRLLRLLGLILLTLPTTPALAQQPVPPLTARVTDLTGTLSADRRQALEARLEAFERDKGSQLAVLLVPTTQPETIEQYGIRVAEAWKLGRKGTDDGLLLLVAKEDRALRIEVGYGLEGVVPDAVAKRVIEEVILPRFRGGDFAGGIDAGVDSLIRLVSGEPLPEPEQRSDPYGSAEAPAWMDDNFPMLIVVMLAAGGLLRTIMGRLVGAGAAGGITFIWGWWLLGSLLAGGVIAGIVFLFTLFGGNRGGIYRGGGGFGGGGGFSGGGGGFGGGGASGRW